MRYFLELAYQGRVFHGWQRQPEAVSVQEKVEDALSVLTQQSIEVVGAGRTDAGVHARQLFAHFDSEQELGKELVFKMNSMLPKEIAIKAVHKMRPQAHARFDALSRSYEYYVIQEKDPFAFGAAYWVKRELDMDKMNRAAELMLGYRDFKCFSRSRTDVRTYNCKLEHAFWEERTDMLVFKIKADRFLRNMVRAIVGTLLEMGLGRMEVEQMHQIIQSKDRTRAGASAPAHGLYLTKVEYPKELFIS